MIDNKLRIPAGNTFATAHTITAQDVQGQPIPDFDLQECTDIQVYARNGGSYKPVTSWQLDDQSVVVLWYGKQMKLGGYDFYIAGKFGGADWRTSEATIFEIVQYNEEANIPADTIVVDGTYFLDASFSLITEIQGGGGGATPSDDLPLMDGTADAGTDTKYSRGDHRHPSDTSKQDKIDNAHKLDYSLLDNTPTIPAAQVNSDWNANSGVAQILNKPAIPAAQVQSDWNEADNTKADYIKNKPTIPAAQVQSDWNEADNTKADYIKNKPTIPSVVDALNSSSTTSALSANQGKVLDESKQDVIDATHKLPYSYISDTPTIPSALSDLSDDSTHRVVTDTEISAWDNKANKVLVNNHGTDDTTYSVTPNVLHIWGTVASLTLTLATPTDNTIKNEYMIQFTSGATATQFAIQQGVVWGDSCGQISLAANKIYQVSVENNLATWESWSVS